MLNVYDIHTSVFLSCHLHICLLIKRRCKCFMFHMKYIDVVWIWLIMNDCTDVHYAELNCYVIIMQCTCTSELEGVFILTQHFFATSLCNILIVDLLMWLKLFSLIYNVCGVFIVFEKIIQDQRNASMLPLKKCMFFP